MIFFFISKGKKRHSRQGFTPLEKAADFNRRSVPFKADGGIKPPSVQTVRELRSLTGFTLVEVLLVAVVLLVLAALVSPNFSETFKSLQLKDTVNRLSYLMRYAQSSAITQENIYRIEFSSDFSSFWLTQKEEPKDESDEEKFTRILNRFGKVYKISEGVQLRMSEPFIYFYTDGKIDKVKPQLCYKAKCFAVSTEEQSGYINVFEVKSP